MLSITFQDVYQTTQNNPLRLGSRGVTPDGREWVYGQTNAALSIGHVAVPQAVTTVAAGTVTSSLDGNGLRTIITYPSATWTVGQFENATVLINAGTGSGQFAKVKTNTATTLILQSETPLATALDATSGFAIWTQFLVRKAVTSTKVQNATGIAQCAFAINDYGWFLTRGQGTVIADTALTIGKSFVTGGATAGEATIGTTAKGPFDEQCLGVCLIANSGADLGAMVFVAID